MSTARSLVQLEVLSIGYCVELKHISTPEEDGDGTNTGEEIIPASLNSHLVLPNLKRLSVFSCHKLEFILPISCLEQLQEIEIEQASQLKHVFGQYDHRDHSSHQDNIQVAFPMLKVLMLKSLENLRSLCPDKYHPRCPSLKEIYVHNCQKLTMLCIVIGMEMRQLHGSKGMASRECQQGNWISKLEKLHLEDLPELMSIWTVPNPRQSLSLQHLQELKVEKCHKLKCLFPTVFCRNLPELTYLTIEECDELEEIMEENEEFENLCNAQVCFLKLETMKISSCRKLKSVFPVALARMLPRLSTLQISYSDQLKEVFRKSSEEGTSNGKEIEVPNLKELKLRKLSSFVGICPGLKLHAVNLLKMDIDDCPKFALTFEATQVIPLHSTIEGIAFEESQQKYLIPKLEKLNLEKLPELKSIWTVPTPRRILSFQYLQVLNVRRCDKLKCLFSVLVSINLPELTSLTVDECEELEEIMEENEELKNLSDTQVCFPKLKTMKISFCRKLKSLFPVALARMLPQLSTLHVSYVDQLKVVFRKSSEESTGNVDGVVVPNLEELKLIKLPSFVGICPGLKLPALNLVKLVIDECPKFAFNTEANQMISDHCITEGPESVTNNSQVTSKEQEKNLTWSVKWMYLKHLEYLKCIGKEPASVSFENLICLRVSGCRKLKFIFCACVFRSLCLLQLKYLYVENCEVLKEIISEEHDQAQEWDSTHTHNKHPRQVCFPKLVYLRIWRCSKLKNVFSISMVKHLPQLVHMEIRKCSQLEQLFCWPSEANDGAVKEMEVVLPNLKGLILSGMPSLSHIFGESNDQLQLQLPALEQFRVIDCPNFSSTTHAALDIFKHRLQYYILDLDFEIRTEEGNDLYAEFLCPNYDSENEKKRWKK